MAVKLYGLAKCSTCMKARAWLDAQGMPHVFEDYRDVPIEPATLKAWAGSLGGWEKLVNRASMTWRNLEDNLKTPASDKEWLSLIAQYPALIRRPVTVYADHSVTVGLNEKRYAEKLGIA
jgi:Spx/MgsR family transcriptional regulator